MKLSKYFTTQELTASQTAKKYQIDNKPSDEIITNLAILANKTLDPIRDFLGRSVKINSGFRSKELNAKIGGVTNSVHTMGCASDLVIPTEQEQNKLFEFLKKVISPLIKQSNTLIVVLFI
ncbi:MAG: D-Ala-D-Ala carboxypeptidase family metallohydrolase [Brevinema sp.]